jgi:rRNA maturation RNase YbeY
MAIAYYTEKVKLPKQFKRRQTSQWINQVASDCGKSTGNIVYLFCDDEKMLEINRQYLQHDYYTDIITFDYTENNKISGDIFISLETVKTNAEKFKTNYEEELHRVIIHGILHLCGYNDKTAEDKKRMRAKEDEALIKTLVL